MTAAALAWSSSGIGFGDRWRRVAKNRPGDVKPELSADPGGQRMPELMGMPLVGLPPGGQLGGGRLLPRGGGNVLSQALAIAWR